MRSIHLENIERPPLPLHSSLHANITAAWFVYRCMIIRRTDHEPILVLSPRCWLVNSAIPPPLGHLLLSVVLFVGDHEDLLSGLVSSTVDLGSSQYLLARIIQIWVVIRKDEVVHTFMGFAYPIA